MVHEQDPLLKCRTENFDFDRISFSNFELLGYLDYFLEKPEFSDVAFLSLEIPEKLLIPSIIHAPLLE